MNYDNIPEELRQLKQWGLFKLEWVEERQKNTKIPFDAINGEKAKSNDRSTWTTFDEALSALNRNSEDFQGLSFFFADGYVGIDIDHVDEEIQRYRTGDYEDNIVSEFMNATRSYTETSQSGTGIHIIIKGEIPGARRRKNNIEMYSEGRFFALTGNIFGESRGINHADIKILYDKYLGQSNVISMPTADYEPNNLSEFQIIQKALDSKIGEQFKTLMYGGWEQYYTSQSEADLAMANYLAFWTGKDFHKMDAIFRQSDLFRPKWDERHGKTTYGVGTLNKAINDTSSVFTSPDQEPTKKYNINFANDKPKKKLPHRSYDDTGATDRIIDFYGTLIKYSYINSCWYIYNGSYWEVDQSGQVRLLVDAMVANLGKEKVVVPDGEDDEEIMKAFKKFVKHSRSNSAKKAVTEELQHRVPVLPEQFDKDKTFLNAANGYINLASGELFDHDKTKMFSKQANVEYSETAPHEEWDKFLNQTFDGNQELINYIQTAIGYSLTGSVIEQIMFVLYGSGRNGKSIFLETIGNIMGNYAKTIQASTLLVKQNSGGPNSDIARLAGARLITSSEPNEGLRLDEGLVKQLTGGDRVVARQLYGQEFEFDPEFKIWLATNHKPIIRGTDDGIWRRIRLIPFSVKIPDSEIDKKLKFKLARESVGILNWAVDGAIKWQKYGLKTPDIVTQASLGYRKEMDVLTGFISDCCETGPGYESKGGELFQSYKKWSEENSEYSMPSSKFGAEMSERFTRVRGSQGQIYHGIRLVQDTRLNFLQN